jgi:hypothetical protein
MTFIAENCSQFSQPSPCVTLPSDTSNNMSFVATWYYSAILPMQEQM